MLAMVLLLCFMPNSPRFLLSQGKEEEALGSLCWLRGEDTDYAREYEQIKDSVRKQVRKISTGRCNVKTAKCTLWMPGGPQRFYHFVFVALSPPEPSGFLC